MICKNLISLIRIGDITYIHILFKLVISIAIYHPSSLAIKIEFPIHYVPRKLAYDERIVYRKPLASVLIFKMN